RHRRAYKRMGLGIVLQPAEALSKPCRNMCAAATGEIHHLLEAMDRLNAWHDRDVNAGATNTLDIALVNVIVEEELGYGARGTIVDLALQHLNVRREVRALGVLLGIRGNCDVEIALAGKRCHKIGTIRVAVRMRTVSLADAIGRIPAQRHEALHAHGCKFLDHSIN